METATRTKSREAVYSRGSATRASAPMLEAAVAKQFTAVDVQAMLQARLQSALDQAMATPATQEAAPEGWWDLVAIGPIKPGAGTTPPLGFNGPLLPNQVIRSGETAYVATILILNMFYPQPSACDVLADFALPYEITYQTGNLTTWSPGPKALNVEHNYSLVPGQAFYVDVLEFKAEGLDEVMYEMNVSARIFGCNENYAPPFAGFAREVVDIDPSLFRPAPGMVSQPIRFMIYGAHPPSEP
jgi:hypothetical protein